MMAGRAVGAPNCPHPGGGRSGPHVSRLGSALAHREDHTRVVFTSLVLAGLAFSLSQTVVSPALPELQRSMHSAAGSLLAASVAPPIVGKLGDLYGRGKGLTAVLLVFAAGSVVCALAGSLGL